MLSYRSTWEFVRTLEKCGEARRAANTKFTNKGKKKQVYSGEKWRKKADVRLMCVVCCVAI